MKSRQSPIRTVVVVAAAIAPVGMFVAAAISLGFGFSGMHHATVAKAALAGDRACTTQLTIHTPPSTADGVCHVVAGTIRDAYYDVNGVRGGSVTYHYLVFYASDGKKYVFDIHGSDDGGVYRSALANHNLKANVLTVDGEAAYVATDGGTSGPAFDPDDGLGMAQLLVGLGAFFVFLGIVFSIVAIVVTFGATFAARALRRYEAEVSERR